MSSFTENLYLKRAIKQLQEENQQLRNIMIQEGLMDVLKSPIESLRNKFGSGGSGRLESDDATQRRQTLARTTKIAVDKFISPDASFAAWEQRPTIDPQDMDYVAGLRGRKPATFTPESAHEDIQTGDGSIHSRLAHYSIGRHHGGHEPHPEFTGEHGGETRRAERAEEEQGIIAAHAGLVGRRDTGPLHVQGDSYIYGANTDPHTAAENFIGREVDRRGPRFR
jgi:hypothetical protein